MRMRISRTGNKGFTLVELTVVLMIIAVATTLVVPQVLGSITSVRLRESARDLLVAARYAHDFATTRRRVCRLVIDTKQQTYHIEYQSDPQRRPHEFKSMSGGPIKLKRLGKGVEFAHVAIDPTRRPWSDDREAAGVITFDPTGGADAAIVQITNGKRTSSLLIERSSGRATLLDRAVDQLPGDREDLDA